MDEMRLGTILLESRIIDESELEKALEIQTLTGGTRPLGQILVEQGLLDRESLDQLLELQQRRVHRHCVALPMDETATDPYVRAAVKAGANELVVSEGRPVQVRVAGSWHHLTADPVRGPEVWDFVRSEMGAEVLEELADRHFVARDYHKPGLSRGRITAFRQFDGVAVLVTLGPEKPFTAEDLGVPSTLLDVVKTGKGLVLVVGERGMGRVETLTCLLQTIAHESSRYVLVLDDAIDFEPSPDDCLVARRRVGETHQDHVAALRTAIREDPDALVIGDVGEPDSFDLALRAAEAGRLVIAWLNAGNVVGALQRVLNFYAAYDVPRVRATLASVLRAVLVRHMLPDANDTGLVAASELLLLDEAARDVLRNGDLNNIHLLLRMENSRSGHSLDRSLLDLLAKGRVRFEDVFARAEEKAWLLERARVGAKGRK